MEEKFRISDIYKKSKEVKKPKFQGIKFHQPKPEMKEEPERGASDKIEFTSLVEKQPEPERVDKINVGSLYSEAVECVRKIYKGHTGQPGVVDKICTLVKRMIDLINADNEELSIAAVDDYPNPGEYFYYHIVNVCIISIYVGLELSYDRLRLIKLGIAAFLHDVGLSKYLDIINQSKRLNPQEYNEVKKHPIIGPQMLDKISDSLDPDIFEVIRQEHERIDGSGYPQGLKDNEIIEYAQIVGLSDVYEAMTHTRPHRDKYTSLDTIKTILGNKYTFDHRLVKALIESIGIFPVGTFVQLNTKEIGQVLKRNPDLPLRPVVNIFFDATGKRLRQPREFDLVANPTVYIVGTTPVPKQGYSPSPFKQ
jgi:HD-GYP domain-containing protein (c-di-GMP phosphodiesterase class II)